MASSGILLFRLASSGRIERCAAPPITCVRLAGSAAPSALLWPMKRLNQGPPLRSQQLIGAATSGASLQFAAVGLLTVPVNWPGWAWRRFKAQLAGGCVRKWSSSARRLAAWAPLIYGSLRGADWLRSLESLFARSLSSLMMMMAVLWRRRKPLGYSSGEMKGGAVNNNANDKRSCGALTMGATKTHLADCFN